MEGEAPSVTLAPHAWAEATIGMYDWDFIGLTAGLSVLVIVLAVARFGVAIAPDGAELVPTITVWLGGLLVLLVVASNLPGAADGIGPHGWTMALLVGGSAIYALVAMRTTLHRRRPR